MRILLISGIVFVHVPHDAETSPFLGLYGFFDWLRVFLGDALFRIGVPCLSAISGYLLFRRGMSGFDYPATIRSKSKTVLLPFLLWNGALFAAVLLIQLFDVGVGYFPDLWNASPREIISHGTALEELPVNVPPSVALMAVAWYALIPTVIGFLLWYGGAARVSGSEAATFTAVAPVTAVVFAVLVLGEPISVMQISGITAVVLAILILSLPVRG